MNTKKIPCLGVLPHSDHVFQVVCPGSKSITNRALLLATLAEGTSTLRGVLFSDDSRHFLKCIQELGFETTVNEEEKIVTITGLGGSIPKEEASIYVGSAGTAARFLTAFLGLSKGTWHLDSSDQMKKRPMAPLLDALKALGCQVTYEGKDGYFPFTLTSSGFTSFKANVNIDKSSQFLSALMIAAVLSPKDFEITLEGSHGMAYAEMTRAMIEQFGVSIPANFDEGKITIPTGQKLKAMEYQIEPDVSGACYFYGVAALTGLSVQVRDVHMNSLQGDIQFLSLLKSMGCRLQEDAEGVIITGPPNHLLKAVNIDMSSFSDQAITLAALAPFSDGPTTITGIGHIRFQESDRLSAIATELGKLGIRCDEGPDSIAIYPGQITAETIDTYEDHRMAMGFSLIGIRMEGIHICNPECCHKTFENYFQVLDNLAIEVNTFSKFN